MRTKKRLAGLFAAAVMLAACGASVRPPVAASQANAGQSAAQTPAPPAQSETLRPLTDETLPQVFAAFFQGRWETVEGAAEHMALPEGMVFFADLDRDDTPELYITYSTGGGKQTGLFAYDVSGAQPEELGGVYLPVAPGVDAALEFSLWEGEKTRVLYTEGELPVGAANPARYVTESFLTLVDGQLSVKELTRVVTEGETAYFDPAQDGRQVDEKEYQELRRACLAAEKPLETIKASGNFDFLEEGEYFAGYIRESLEQWRKDHPQT